jgi:homocysteine S-methyltransferase
VFDKSITVIFKTRGLYAKMSEKQKKIDEIIDPIVPTKEEYAPIFRRDKFYCLDGGFTSTLKQFYTASVDVDADPLWSCRALKTDPQAVIKTHEAFINAGANIITTNTYQGHHELFRKHIKDFKDPVKDPHLIMEQAVDMVDQALINATGLKRGPHRLVAGSVGPYGACQGDGSEYTGSYIDTTMTRDSLRDWHKDRITRLTFNEGVSIIAAETLPSYVEALAILDTLEDFPGIRCWISFQCKDDAHTAAGEPIEEAFRQLVAHPLFLRVRAVGVNCVKPSQVTPLLKCLNKVNRWSVWPENHFYQQLPYVVYPNGGEDWDAVNKCWVGSCQDIVSHIREWMLLGANGIGGCCKVGPDVIDQISNEIILNMCDVANHRLNLERESGDPRQHWANVQKRLKKPSYEVQRERMNAAKEFFRDATEAGDAQALITAQLEAMMAHENKEVYQVLKNLELRDPMKCDNEDESNDFLKADEMEADEDD